jgi:hypothetical protein
LRGRLVLLLLHQRCSGKPFSANHRYPMIVR